MDLYDRAEKKTKRVSRDSAEVVRVILRQLLRARAEINSHFGASAGRADARRRDEGDVGHRRGAATKPIRALRRRAPAGCGPQARWLCCSLLTYRPGYCSSLAPRQRAWGPAAKWEVISARTLGGAEVDDVVLVAPMQQHRQSGRSQLQNSREFPAQLEIASLPFGYFFDLSSGATATLPINPIAGKQVEGLASGLLDGLRY